jgi:hypothetical protein
MSDLPVNAESRVYLLVLLDACCLLNLCATRLIVDILRALPLRFAVADRAAAEVRYLRRGGDGQDADVREPIDIQPLVAVGLLDIFAFATTDEEASFVNFAANIDDGEAMTCALAWHRQAAVATDDLKTLRILRALAPPLPTYTTANLLRQWADEQKVAGPDLKRVLVDIEERARFVPGRHDPLRLWWLTAKREG